MRWWLILVAGCASAGRPDLLGHADGGPHTDGNGTQIDAFVSTIDAPPGQQTMTLSETTNATAVDGASLACGNGSKTFANSYYRVFDLATFGITTDFHVTQVSFQVEDSTGMSVAARVGTYTGTPGTTLATGGITILTSNATVTVPVVNENSGDPPALINVPLTATITAGKKALVEIDAPDGGTSGEFYLGANAGGQSAPGYFLATSCSVNAPTDISNQTGHTVDLIMTVTGTY